MSKFYKGNALQLVKGMVVNALLVVIVCPTLVFAQQKKVVLATPVAEGKVGGYLEALPDDYAANPNKRYPLILFIHGIGEVGDGSDAALEKVKRNGPPYLLSAGKFPASFTVNAQTFKFIVISPQFNAKWPSAVVISKFFTYLKENYRIDTTRIYLTGLSMGGGTVWQHSGYNAEYASKLAAIAPFCGAASASLTRAQVMASQNLPIWAFHNLYDPTVDVRNTTGHVNYFNGCTPTPSPLARMSLFDAISHNCWTKGYDPNYRENGMNVYEWFLTHRRGAGAIPPPPSPNTAPVALAGSDLSIVQPASSVTLNGTNSYDNDGTISKYSWKQVNGTGAVFNNAAAAQTGVSGLTAAGVYSFSLTVTDNEGAMDSDTVLVHVNSTLGNKLPIAIADGQQQIVMPQSSITADASKSYDPDGSIKNRYWYQTAGAPVQISNQWVTQPTISGFSGEGKYSIVLRVTDDLNGVSYDTLEVSVSSGTPANKVPVALASAPQEIHPPSNSFVLDATGSYDSDGSIASYYWYQIAGAVATISNAYAIAPTVSNVNTTGNYTFVLRVTDNSSAKAYDTVTISVTESILGNLPPVAVAEMSQGIQSPESSVTVTGKNSFDPDGKIKNYYWYQVQGPTATISNVWHVSPTISNLVATGEYKFVLRVMDTTNAKGVDTLVIRVNSLPVSIAGADLAITLPISSVTLDGSASYVPGGSIKNYYWTQIGGANAIFNNRWMSKPTISGLTSAGVYQFSLRLMDWDNLVDYDTVNVVVKSVPVAARMQSGTMLEATAKTGNQSLLSESGTSLTLFPNPVESIVNIKFNSSTNGRAIIKLVNIQGIEVRREYFEKVSFSHSQAINLSGLPAGSYVMQVLAEDKVIHSVKLLKL